MTIITTAGMMMLAFLAYMSQLKYKDIIIFMDLSFDFPLRYERDGFS